MRISDWSSDVCSSDLRLRWTPVSAITGVTGVPAEGAAFALPIGAYGVDIDGNGDGWVRVTAPGAAGRVDVTFMAGLATDWAGGPEAIRQGAVRLGGDMFAQRAGEGSGAPAGGRSRKSVVVGKGV